MCRVAKVTVYFQRSSTRAEGHNELQEAAARGLAMLLPRGTKLFAQGWDFNCEAQLIAELGHRFESLLYFCKTETEHRLSVRQAKSPEMRRGSGGGKGSALAMPQESWVSLGQEEHWHEKGWTCSVQYCFAPPCFGCGIPLKTTTQR